MWDYRKLLGMLAWVAARYRGWLRREWDYRKQLREYNEARRRALEADRPDRWPRLSPEAAAQHVATLRKAGRIARTIPAPRPCHYRPWSEALEAATDDVVELFLFCSDAACGGGWPPEHAHLVDFALTFLEEDPMLFRSGYVKKALARRLKQATLTEADIARLTPIFQRAVTEGTGLEEFKPLCRLAQKTRPPGLWDWLEEQRDHPDERVRRNARYMREAGIPWWMMHRSNERYFGLSPP